MSENAILVWAVLLFAVLLNGCAAGIVAVLHAWGSKMRRGGKAVTAVLVTGLVTTTIFLPIAFSDPEFAASEDRVVMGLVLALIMALAMAVSLPGALVVSRKLEQPSNDLSVFD